MPVLDCHDCAEMHNRKTKIPGYSGYGTCPCICPQCGNRGRMICNACTGKGASGWLGRRCKQCAGERTIVCPTCMGYLADPRCPLCKGTSCETCYGSRQVDLETILGRLKPRARRRITFRATGSLRPDCEMEFPVFTYESTWRRLGPLLDFDPQLTICRDAAGECVHLAGKLIDGQRSYYTVYRFAPNEYGVEESFSHLESAGACPLAP